MLEISLKFLGFGTNADRESCPDKQNRTGPSLVGPQNRMLHPHIVPEHPIPPTSVSGTHSDHWTTLCHQQYKSSPSEGVGRVCPVLQHMWCVFQNEWACIALQWKGFCLFVWLFGWFLCSLECLLGTQRVSHCPVEGCMKWLDGWELRKTNYSISIKQENSMLMKHLFKSLTFQYEISTWRRGHLLGVKF